MTLPAWTPLTTLAEPPPARRHVLVAEVDGAGQALVLLHPEGWPEAGPVVLPEDVRRALGGLGARPAPLGVPWAGLTLAGARRPGGGYVLFGAASPSALLADLAERLPVAVLRLSLDGVLLAANEAARTLTGHPDAALVGEPLWHRLVHPEDRWKLTQALRVARAGDRAAATFRLHPAEGPARVVEAHLFPDPAAEALGAVVLDLTEQSEVEAALHQSEALYNTFLEQSPIGLVHLDATGTVTFENHRFRQLVGERPEDAWIGLSAFRILGTDGLFSSAVKRLLDGRSVSRFDVRYEPPGRTSCALLLTGAPILQADGHVVGAVLMFEDVTHERRQAAEAALRDRFARAEDALRAVALAEPDEAAFLREALRAVTDATEAARGALLLPPRTSADALLDPFATTGAAPFPPLTDADGRALADARAPLALDPPDPARPAERAAFPLRDDAGPAGWFVLDRLGRPEPLLGGLRGRLTESLVGLAHTLWRGVQTAARHRLTVATLDDALFTFAPDADGRRYLLLTPQVERITGHPPAHFADAPGAWEALPADDAARAAAEAHATRLAAGEESTAVYRIRTADGALRWIRERARPRADDRGTPVVAGVVADVTAEQEALAALHDARTAAEQASRDKTALLTTLSHELRTPLGALRGFADLLAAETGPETPPNVAEFAATIRDQAAHVLGLVTALLDLSRLDAGRAEIRPAATPLNPLVQGAVLRHAGGARPLVRTRLALDEHGPVVLADPERATQALDEVLSNAYKFTHEGVVRVATETDGGWAVVTVDDTGIGMAADYRARLFTPLLQEDQRLNRDYNGAGLGLALAQRLVVALGGAIEVDSEKGRGTTVRIRLPLVPEGDTSPVGVTAPAVQAAG